MRSRFNDLEGRILLCPMLDEPFCKLPGQQFPKKRAHAYAGIKVPFPSNAVSFLFIISINGTIQRQLHEARKGDRALLRYLGSDFLAELAQRRSVVRI